MITINDSFGSVALTGPAVFQFTAPSSPSRHREILAVFRRTVPSDPSIANIPDRSLGDHLYEAIAEFTSELGVPRGLNAVGYGSKDVEMLVQGTLPQRRVLDLAPGIGASFAVVVLDFVNLIFFSRVGDVAGEDGAEHLRNIISRSMSY